MPITNTYHLYVDVTGLHESESAVAGEKSSSSGESQESQFEQAVSKKAKNLITYATLVGTAQKIVTNEVSLMKTKTGALEYEQKIQATRKFTNPIVSAVGVGLATGNVYMAGFTLLAEYVSLGIDIMQTQRRLGIEETVEDIGQSFQSRRIGVNSRRNNNL